MARTLDIGSMTKKEGIAYFKERLSNDPNWQIRGLMRIYSFQTASEQMMQATAMDNGVGFTGTDANILSSFAKQVESGRLLSQKQRDILKKKMPKYAGQLYKVALEKAKQLDDQ